MTRLVEFDSGVQRVRDRAAVALAYPLIVCGLASIVLAWICTRAIPSTRFDRSIAGSREPALDPLHDAGACLAASVAADVAGL